MLLAHIQNASRPGSGDLRDVDYVGPHIDNPARPGSGYYTGEGDDTAFAGATQVYDLQSALKYASTTLKNQRLDPLEYSGAVGGGTVAATYNAAKMFGSQVPGLSNLVSLVNSIPGISFLIDALSNPPTAAAVWPQIPVDYRISLQNMIDQIASAPGLRQVLHAVNEVIESTPPSPSSKFTTARTVPQLTLRSYPTGSVARLNVVHGSYSIYSPLHGALGGVSAFGDPPPPPGFTKAGNEIMLPSGVVLIGKEDDERELPPWYKNWKVWAIIGGVAVAGAGTIYLLK